MRSQWGHFLVHAFISSSAAVIMPECAIYSPRSARQTFNVGMGRDWGNNTICSHNQSLPGACLSDLATFYLKGAVDNCCCSNTNQVADKIIMAWYLWHVHVQDVITSCYKWIRVPEFDRTNSSFYRDIWLVANCYLWQSWWRDSDHHCDHVTSLTSVSTPCCLHDSVFCLVLFKRRREHGESLVSKTEHCLSHHKKLLCSEFLQTCWLPDVKANEFLLILGMFW